MPTNPSLGWQKLLYAYYNIRKCYESLNWPVNHIFSSFNVAISPNTTLLALADKSVANPSVIEVYSVSGNKIWSLFHNSGVAIVGFAFHNENLVVVLANYKFRLYTDFHRTFNEYAFTENVVSLRNVSEGVFSTGPSYKPVITNLETNETEEALEIVETHVWGDFLVVRFGHKVAVTHIGTFANYEIPLDGLDPLQIHTFSLLSVNHSVLDFLISYSSTIYQVTLDTGNRTVELSDKVITVGPFTKIAVSPSGAFVALLNEQESKIFVTNRLFDRELMAYDTLNESSAPYMMEWTGEDAIILSLREEIKLIGPHQSSISFFYDMVDDFDLSYSSTQNFTVPIIKLEKDGLKIITDSKVEFLLRVPQCAVDLLLVGSLHPSSVLLDCVDKLQHQSSKADTNIAYLKSEGLLETAIQGCLEAALDEFSPIWQKKILQAASFGKLYYDDYFDAERYLGVVNAVKVLNQIRSPEIGVFLTYRESQHIGWSAVVQMLIKRSQHLLALKVAQILNLDTQPVYVDWCCRKIMLEPEMGAGELFKVILKKLISSQNHKNTVSISEIFRLSQQEGRTDLCKLLVDLEPVTMQKVSLLLEIGETELALVKCFESVDADLCRLLLLHLKNTLSETQFGEILDQVERKNEPRLDTSGSLPENTYIQTYLRDDLFVSGDVIGNFWEQTILGNRDRLESYYKYSGSSLLRTKMKIQNYIGDTSQVAGADYEAFYQAKKSKLASISDRKLAKLVSIELELLDVQHKLSETYQQSFFEEKSLVGVLEKLISMKQAKVASDIARTHKVSAQKLWNLVLEKYSKDGEFERLHAFIFKSSKSKPTKAPISFETIAETCIFYGAPKDHISQYIGCCTDVSASRRAELYLKNDDLARAAEEALKTTDIELLKHISYRSQDGDAAVHSAVQQYLSKL